VEPLTRSLFTYFRIAACLARYHAQLIHLLMSTLKAKCKCICLGCALVPQHDGSEAEFRCFGQRYSVSREPPLSHGFHLLFSSFTMHLGHENTLSVLAGPVSHA
jgi:hypothetical protein